jgi:CheY-like chemotaxis protein
VVVVEDQSDARRMLQILLERDGLQVFTASNGQEGAELIARVKPDLAFVDLGLPVMSGYGQDSDVQAALDAGFDEHLAKPPDPARLEQLLLGE